MGWVVWGLKGRGTAFFFTAAMLGMIICLGGPVGGSPDQPTSRRLGLTHRLRFRREDITESAE